jgi:hypothetical protein
MISHLPGTVVSDFLVEDVTTPRHCLDNLLRLIAEGVPNILQALHQRIIGYCRVNPDSMDQFIFADESTIVLDQIPEDLKRLGAQSYLFLTLLQTTARQVERELVKGMYLVGQLLQRILGHGGARMSPGFVAIMIRADPRYGFSNLHD